MESQFEMPAPCSQCGSGPATVAPSSSPAQPEPALLTRCSIRVPTKV